MGTIVFEVLYAIRRLSHAWRFTLFAVVTLAVGIGATAAIYSVAYALLFRRPDIRDVDHVVNIYHSRSTNSSSDLALSWPDIESIRSAQTAFSELMEWSFFVDAVSDAASFDVVRGEMVSVNYFSFVGAVPAIGRTFGPSDDAADSHAVVISHGYWRSHFASDPAAIGRAVNLKGQLFTVIGIMPPTFRGVDLPNVMPTNLWVPIRMAALLLPGGPGNQIWSDREHRWVFLKARLSPAVSVQAAQAQISAISDRLNETAPIGVHSLASTMSPSRHREFRVAMTSSVHAHESVDFLAVPLSGAVLTAVLLCLLVACTNLANLLLARGARVRRDVAVRRALGASRWQVLRMLVLENALIAAMGGGCGLILASGLIRLIAGTIAIGRGFHVSIDPHINGAVVIVGILSTVLAVLVFGLVPAWHNTRISMRHIMDADGGGVVGRWRGRRFLIVCQVMVCTALLVIGALFARTALRSSSHDPGFILEKLLIADLDYSVDSRSENKTPAILFAAVRRLEEEPGIKSVSVLNRIPIYSGGSKEYVFVGTEPQIVANMNRADTVHFVNSVRATPEVFATLGIRLLAGRSFTQGEVAGASRVVVIARSVAVHTFGSDAVVGRTLFVGTVPYTVIGVVSDTDTDVIGNRERGFVFLPFTFEYKSSVLLVSRATGDPATLIDEVKNVIHSVGSGLPLVEILTGTEVIAQQTFVNRTGAYLTLLLGFFALVLALVGVSGLLGYLVSSRQREIGIRMALGANSQSVINLIVWDGLRPVVIGVSVGLTIGLLLSYVVSTLLLRTNDIEVTGTILVALVLLTAAFVACYLPARVAARIDPSVALRSN